MSVYVLVEERCNLWFNNDITDWWIGGLWLVEPPLPANFGVKLLLMIEMKDDWKGEMLGRAPEEDRSLMLSACFKKNQFYLRSWVKSYSTHNPRVPQRCLWLVEPTFTCKTLLFSSCCWIMAIDCINIQFSWELWHLFLVDSRSLFIDSFNSRKICLNR